jgi:hypothetical protein
MIPRLLPPLACAILAGGCSLFDHSAKVTLASDPPGARVLFEERDSGFVTPCVLELDPDETRHLSLELPGYEKAHRLLVPERDAYVILWRDMYLRSSTWYFPTWLNTRDFFEPIKVDKRMSPSRIFVRLERTADK